MKNKYISILLAFVLLVSVGFAGCGSQSKMTSQSTSSMSSYEDATDSYEEVAEAPMTEMVAKDEMAWSVNTTPDTGGGDNSSETIRSMNPEAPSLSGRKLIVNTTLTLETKEFDATRQLIQRQVNAFGGYVENSEYENTNIYQPKQSRRINYVLRIPAGKSADFLASLDEGSFNILSSHQNVQDITESFFDLEARRDSLVEQKERLERLMGTNADLEYLIQVEQEIAKVSYEINVIHNQLRNMESLVDFSTITIFLNEVVEYVEPIKPDFTFWQRIKNTVSYTWKGTVDGLQNLVLFVISSVPTLIMLGILAVIAIIIWRAVRKKRALKPKVISQGNLNQAYIPPTPEEKVPSPLSTDNNKTE